jgi:cell fate regulator YaaT (PSP1 superfamily)
MQEAVKIRLRKPTRVFTFSSKGITLRRDDPCIVKSDRGLEYGTCVVPPEPCGEDLGRRLKMTIVRKANFTDESNYQKMISLEKKAYDVCKAKIAERKLPMKLVDAEYTFDRNKVVFYFTAADRVDFRQLVRDLAQELKTRIELRHIQVRDEAKIVGGLGVCGRELCCSTWLPEFKPISMKMAKRQNLSLNPNKISGQCGRLLCCLSYENELYKAYRKPSRPPALPEEDASLDEAVAPVPEDNGETPVPSAVVEAVRAEPEPADAPGEVVESPPESTPVEVESSPSEAPPDASAEEKAETSEAVESSQGAAPSGDTKAKAAGGDDRQQKRRRSRRRRGKGGKAKK